MAEEVPETDSAGFFSSHPSSTERFAALQREAEALSPSHETRRATGETPEPRPVVKRNEQACQEARQFFYRAKDMSDGDKKIALYQRGLRLCPESPRAHAELAAAYVDLGENREAVEEYREALRYDPDYPGVRDRLLELEDRRSGGG
jgi:tetratricopeptide (TPR) repeat protein